MEKQTNIVDDTSKIVVLAIIESEGKSEKDHDADILDCDRGWSKVRSSHFSLPLEPSRAIHLFKHTFPRQFLP
jgi:hypothetical protein